MLLIQREVEITHFYPNECPNNPHNFSKHIIKIVLRPQDWVLSTNRAVPIKHGNETYSFNY